MWQLLGHRSGILRRKNYFGCRDWHDSYVLQDRQNPENFRRYGYFIEGKLRYSGMHSGTQCLLGTNSSFLFGGSRVSRRELRPLAATCFGPDGPDGPGGPWTVHRCPPGYEPKFWWWDILVKRVDIGLMNIVTYTSIEAWPHGQWSHGTLRNHV